MAGLGMDLPRLLASVRARRWLIVGCAAAAAAAALGVSLSQSDRFQARADLLFGRMPLTGILGTATTDSVFPQGQAATDLALASLGGVAARVAERVAGSATADDLKNAVDVEQKGQTDLVRVTAEWDSPAEAAVVANAFAEEIVAVGRERAQTQVQRAIDAVNRTLETQGAGGQGSGSQLTDDQALLLSDRVAQLEVLKGLQTGDAEIVQRATAPDAHRSPRPVRNAIVAGVIGLLIGLFLAVMGERFDQPIRSEEELAALISAPVLGRIPRSRTPRRRTTSGNANGPESASQRSVDFKEAFQLLQLYVQLRRPEGKGLVLGVTSPEGDAGKTTVVAWLAHSLARTGSEVVAVDLDLRNPTLGARFDLRASTGGGVLEALIPTSNVALLLQPTYEPTLRVMVGTQQHALPSPTVGHDRVHGMLEELRVQADYVLVDTAPVSTVAHAAAAAAACDGVILVVDLQRVRRRELLAACEQLAHARAEILGIVLNRVPADTGAQYRDGRRVQVGSAEKSYTTPVFTA